VPSIVFFVWSSCSDSYGHKHGSLSYGHKHGSPSQSVLLMWPCDPAARPSVLSPRAPRAILRSRRHHADCILPILVRKLRWHNFCHRYPQMSPSNSLSLFVHKILCQHKLSWKLSQYEVRYLCALERLADASPFSLLLDTRFSNLSSSIHVPCRRTVTILGHSLHQFVVFVCWFVSKLLSHDPGACAPPLLLILAESNRLPLPALSRQLLIFIAYRTFFTARLLPCEDCSICAVVPFCQAIHNIYDIWYC